MQQQQQPQPSAQYESLHHRAGSSPHLVQPGNSSGAQVHQFQQQQQQFSSGGGGRMSTLPGKPKERSPAGNQPPHTPQNPGEDDKQPIIYF